MARPLACKEIKEFTNEIEAIIDKSGLTYREVLNALNYIVCIIRQKGDNLLDEVSIQEVVSREKVKW